MPELILLKPYLDAPDFRVALRAIAKDFRASLGLPGDIDELGVVCPDVEVAAAWLQDNYGAGPFMLAEGAPAKFTQGGDSQLYRTRVGFGYYEDILIELAEPGIGSDIFDTHLDPGGQITIHHLGYFARGKRHKIDGTNYAKAMKKAGFDAPQWTASVFAGITGNVALYKTYAVAENASIEFLDFRLAGLPIPYPRIANELIAKFQVKHGPRLIKIPGPSDEPLKLQWGFHASRVVPGKTPDEVWPWVSDPEKLGEWWGAKVTGGPAAVGTKWQIKVDMNGDGESVSMVEELTAVRPPYEWQSKSKNSDLFSQSETVLTVTDDPQGTRVVWQVSFVPEQSFHGLELADDGDDWMEDSLDRLETMAGDGEIGGEVIFRHYVAKDRGIIKIKGKLAQMLYDSLSEPVRPNRCQLLFPKKCKRMGQSMIGSTENIVDKVVLEIRFTPDGKLAELNDDWELYHSFRNNRHYGIGTFDGNSLRMSGDTATELRKFLGSSGGSDVVLNLVNLAQGAWTLESL